MECFNTLLIKLREVHEREVEGWQVKIQELSNKKGCDSKRMEELFSKNQQMKEQQRLLTENIKTLENRLRAGLCDRCTVTQEMAKRRQQELEASQIQSIQHISILMAEITNLRKENKRLRDEIRNSRASLDGSTPEVKLNSSPDPSPFSGQPEALVGAAAGRAHRPPADGDVAVKSEAEQRADETQRRQWCGMNRGSFSPLSPESNKLLASSLWKREHGATRGDKRAHTAEGVLAQLSSIPPQALLLKNIPSFAVGEVSPSRHVLHAPVPCRPVKSSTVTLPWPLSESPEWVARAAASGTGLVVQPPLLKQNPPRYPNLIPTSQHAGRQVFNALWNKQGPLKHPAKEPTVLFRLRGPSESDEAPTKPQERMEIRPSKDEKVSGEGLRHANEGPLDLSDRGKSKSGQMPKDYSPLASQDVERAQNSPDRDLKTNSPTQGLVSFPSPVIPPSSSITPPVKHQEVEPAVEHNHKVITEPDEQENVNGNSDQSNQKKVPVLTISLRPVTLLETLNSSLKKQESLSSNGKSPVAEVGGSLDERDEEETASCQESNQGCKRKRLSVEMETDRGSNTDDVQQERNIKITVRNEEKSLS